MDYLQVKFKDFDATDFVAKFKEDCVIDIKDGFAKFYAPVVEMENDFHEKFISFMEDEGFFMQVNNNHLGLRFSSSTHSCVTSFFNTWEMKSHDALYYSMVAFEGEVTDLVDFIAKIGLFENTLEKFATAFKAYANKIGAAVEVLEDLDYKIHLH